MRWLAPVVALLAMVAASACRPDVTTGPDTARDDVRADRLEIEDGFYFGLAWPSHDLIVTSRSFGPPALAELVTVRRHGDDLRVVPVPLVDGCQQTRYEFPSTVSDGRVVIGRICDAPQGVVPVATYAIVAVDLDTGATTVLSDIGPDFHPRASSWNPALTRGVAAQSSSICASLAWLSGDGVEDMEFTLGSGDRSWRVDEELRSDECTGGRADWPAWSPDGRSIAFMASPESVGVRGQRRVDKPWDLYVMGAAGSDPASIVRGIEHGRSTSWSPDSSRIAFAAEDGVFVVGASGGRRRKVSSLGAEWLAWSPDGTELAAIVGPEDADVDQQRTQLYVLDVAAAFDAP